MKQEVASSEVAAGRLCVVLDTNVWRSELLLRSPLGVALIYALRASNGRLGLPEVVGEEMERVIVKAGSEAGADIEKGFATIQRIVGYRSRYSLPSQEVMRQSVSARLAELDPLIERVAFTLEQAKRALRRVYEETPPNGAKNQQFKDSVIWEAVLELAREYRVHFITGDNDFFEGRKPANGLARVLRSEVEGSGRTVEVYHDLSMCLAVLRRETPAVDEPHLAAAIEEAIREDISGAAADRSFQLLELVKSKLEVFLTEQASVLSVAFELTYRMEDAEGREGLGRTEAMAYGRGDCSYSSESRAVSEFSLDEVEFVWRDENLQMQRSKNIYARVGDGIRVGDGVGGSGSVGYRLRVPLGEGQEA